MKTIPTAAAFALALGLAAPALGQDAPPMPEQLPADAAFSASYLCDGGAVLQAAYINPPDGGPSYATIYWAGKLIPMQSGPTASGVRYAPFDQTAAVVWHTKGDAGTLITTSPEALAADEVALSCSGL